jgi:hypothetical protein
LHIEFIFPEAKSLDTPTMLLTLEIPRILLSLFILLLARMAFNQGYNIHSVAFISWKIPSQTSVLSVEYTKLTTIPSSPFVMSKLNPELTFVSGK